jgi:DNA topoisomerase-2
VAEALYGKNTELRKEIHSKPLRNWTEEEQIQVVKSRHANLASVLMIETGSFQSDNIARKLDHIIDGQNQAGRKILAGVMKIFRGDNSKRKVADLAGEITRITGYEHGEASMEDSIKYRAFIAVGGRQLPLLLPKGMFGTRKTGTDGAGASRYIYCKLNKNLTKAIFPPVDFDLLKFGSTLEPEYFVPTIPMCALETTQMPGTGWKICTWARDVYDVLDNVRLMVLTDDSATLKAMKPCTYKGSPYQWNGRFVWFQSVQYTVGKYDILDNRTIRITELPLMTWVDNYVLTLIKLLDEELIVDYKDRSTDVDVDIEVKLAIGALDKITSQFGNSTFDPIETYFQLCTPMHNQLNFYDIGCKVYSTKDYEEILHRWFPVRKELYSRRVDRVIILLEIRIFQMESVIKYLRSALDLRGQSLVQINKIIAEAGYNRLNVGLLDSPGTLQNAELRAAIIDGPGSTYNYLINLRDYDRSSEQMERFEAKLSDLRSELERYLSKSNEGKFKGAAIWLDELAEIRKIIDDGARTGWKFEDFQRYTF